MTRELQQGSDAKPLLTIAIPTYNRARFLRELLSVLSDQLVVEPRVELIISDNASPDETHTLVREFVERGLQVRYLRNQTNIGSDANFMQCFEQARGKYVWILSDDDVVVTDAIRKIVTYLEAEEYDLVYVNAYSFEGSGTPRTLRICRKPTKIDDPRIFVRRVHVFLTFISGNIVNKDRVVASKHSPLSALVGTNLVQLGWTFTALNGYVRGLYIHEKLVGMRVNNTGGYNLPGVFGPTLKSITQKWIRSRELQRLVINGTLQRFWPGMLLAYRSSKGKLENEASPSKILTPAFKDNYRYWVFAYPILVMPFALAKCWLFAVRVVNRADKALGFRLMN